MNKSDIQYATSIGSITLVGSFGDFPRKSGNCFSVFTKDGEHERRVLNFNYENLKECIRRGVDWPIKIKVYGNKYAIIHDERIPPSWYDSEYCEICSPEKYWPEPQRLRKEREIEAGVIKKGKIDLESGIQIVKRQMLTVYKGFEDLNKEKPLGYTYGKLTEVTVSELPDVDI